MVVALSVGVVAAAWAATPPAAGEKAVCAGASGATGKAVEELGVTVNAKGTAYYYDDRRMEVWVTIGAGHGLRPQAQVVLMRKGEKVAEGTVISVRDMDSIVRPAKGTPAGTILLGDDVRVVSNGPRSALDKVIAREHRERNVLTVLVYAMFTYCISAAR